MQLQALVGITKFDAKTNSKNPITIQTDSHGIIRNTFLKLAELGYLQNYEETKLKDRYLVLPKLAFGNTDIKTKVPIYNMRFQRTDKPIDFKDPEFQKMFPMVFAKRGILEKCNYEIERKENGEYVINYSKKTPKIHPKKEEESLRDSVKSGISLDDQKKCIERFLNESQPPLPPLPPNKDMDIEQ